MLGVDPKLVNESLSRRSFLIGSSLAVPATLLSSRDSSSPPVSVERARDLLKVNDLDEAISSDPVRMKIRRNFGLARGTARLG